MGTSGTTRLRRERCPRLTTQLHSRRTLECTGMQVCMQLDRRLARVIAEGGVDVHARMCARYIGHGTMKDGSISHSRYRFSTRSLYFPLQRADKIMA